MPFDMNFLPFNYDMPESIDFDIAFEPTKVDDQKYVINTTTGEYLRVVGKDFTCVSHPEHYNGVVNTIVDTLGEEALTDAQVTWRVARNGGWSMMDMVLPSVTNFVRTSKHETEVSQRVISLHGVDASCSSLCLHGWIDSFCTNGCISGEHDKVKRKHTSGFNFDMFQMQLRDSQRSFREQAEKLQLWAEHTVYVDEVKAMLDDMIKSKQKAEKMYALYCAEASVRGHNKYAVYSAFTNYSSWADERNGFNLRDTGYDTKNVSMFNRELEVSQWIDSPQFRMLSV
jgi:hypothetical protein|tara:strand:+ start:51 stop:905 length:855 start_codon:yes stop_codon:yes gene_type:complete